MPMLGLLASALALAAVAGGLSANVAAGKPLRTGDRDDVTPIASGADLVAERLRGERYRVVYRRFAGGHRPVPDVARQLVRRALGR
jgi:hypothetical protein